MKEELKKGIFIECIIIVSIFLLTWVYNLYPTELIVEQIFQNYGIVPLIILPLYLIVKRLKNSTIKTKQFTGFMMLQSVFMIAVLGQYIYGVYYEYVHPAMIYFPVQGMPPFDLSLLGFYAITLPVKTVLVILAAKFYLFIAKKVTEQIDKDQEESS